MEVFRVASVRVMNLVKLICKGIVKAKDLRVYACLREREGKRKREHETEKKKEGTAGSKIRTENRACSLFARFGAR